ncbi:MAG: PepSY domain-containing protein, partial [candidate division Zixibacteria bacterium]|nr:PepSY domain-containing protein [candidate division Zixibacteria bacterium]
YQGFEIAHSDLRVYFTPDGDLRDIDGEFHYDINLSTNYSIDSATAVEIALNELGTLTEGVSPKIHCSGKPVIVPSSDLQLPDERKLYLVWKVGVALIKPPPSDDSIGTGIYKVAKYAAVETGRYYLYFIDANSGQILFGGRSPRPY